MPTKLSLINLGINIEAVPEALQNVPGQTRHTIEEAKAEKIAVEEI